MAHSYVMYYKDELKAFRQFASVYPNNCILLIDTYDVLDSGIKNAITVFKEMKEKGIKSKNYGVRIDSGDLAYLTKEVRKILDKEGFKDAKIVVSNSLDEYTIVSILDQGACIDSFGVGERMITSKSEPVFGGVYKLSAVEENGIMEPRIKVSESVEKITNPGLKSVYRVYNDKGHAFCDLIAKYDEKVDLDKPFRYVDPEKPWRKDYFKNCTLKSLQQLVIKNGKRTFEKENLKDIRDYVKYQLDNEIWDEEQRFENPHIHYLDMTPDFYEMKMNMLYELNQKKAYDCYTVKNQL